MSHYYFSDQLEQLGELTQPEDSLQAHHSNQTTPSNQNDQSSGTTPQLFAPLQAHLGTHVFEVLAMWGHAPENEVNEIKRIISIALRIPLPFRIRVRELISNRSEKEVTFDVVSMDGRTLTTITTKPDGW
jgi:hypothetical protein